MELCLIRKSASECTKCCSPLTLELSCCRETQNPRPPLTFISPSHIYPRNSCQASSTFQGAVNYYLYTFMKKHELLHTVIAKLELLFYSFSAEISMNVYVVQTWLQSSDRNPQLRRKWQLVSPTFMQKLGKNSLKIVKCAKVQCICCLPFPFYLFSVIQASHEQEHDCLSGHKILTFATLIQSWFLTVTEGLHPFFCWTN